MNNSELETLEDKEIGYYFKTTRTSINMSLNTVCRKLGVNRTHYVDWEKGVIKKYRQEYDFEKVIIPAFRKIIKQELQTRRILGIDMTTDE